MSSLNGGAIKTDLLLVFNGNGVGENPGNGTGSTSSVSTEEGKLMKPYKKR